MYIGEMQPQIDNESINMLKGRPLIHGRMYCFSYRKWTRERESCGGFRYYPNLSSLTCLIIFCYFIKRGNMLGKRGGL